MNRRARWGLTFALALAVLQASAFAQAAGESVLLNSTSAAATAKAGKAFKAASDRVGKQLAGRVEREMSPPARKTATVTTHPASASRPSSDASSEGKPSGNGAVIASIQGGQAQGAEATCTPAERTEAKPEGQTAAAPAAAPAQADCKQQGSPSKAGREEHSSVITLSFSK